MDDEPLICMDTSSELIGGRSVVIGSERWLFEGGADVVVGVQGAWLSNFGLAPFHGVHFMTGIARTTERDI